MTGPDGLLAALLLGALQGVTEWLPISSEGAVAATYSLAYDRPLGEAVSYALWLHLGTAVSALIAFRGEVAAVVREAVTLPRKPSPMLRFLIVGTLVSVVIGVPVLIGLDEISETGGSAAMLLVGALLLATAAFQSRMPRTGLRGRDDLGDRDAALTGVAQGLAALPGLSRSGLTVAALLGRGIDRREALALSFLLSVPASLGAGLWGGAKEGLAASPEALVALAVAAVVGLATIRILLAVAERVRFGPFVALIALAVIAGAVWRIAVA